MRRIHPTYAIASLVCLCLLAVALTGCTQRTEDGFALSDGGSIAEETRIAAGSWPSGYPGLGAFAYALGKEGVETGEVHLYDLEKGAASQVATEGMYPSLCAEGLYYFDNGALMLVGFDSDEGPLELGMSGYVAVRASPGNVWLILVAPETSTSAGRISLNNRQTEEIMPLALSEENDPAHPMWVTDDRLVVDAVAPQDSGFDRAVYSVEINESGDATATLVKLGVQVPADNGAGLLACLEVPEGDPSPSLAVYDLDAKERIAVLAPDGASTFGALCWVAENTLAVEVETRDVGTDIVLYTVER